jgi:uncharacterized protein (TIGR04255 family)
MALPPTAITGTSPHRSPFPDSQRVIYSPNPLAEVICQLRFPPILRVAAELPAAFQDKIRRAYPILRERRGTDFEMPPGMPAAVSEIVRGLPTKRPGSYEFISEDEKWKVVLASEFLALSTPEYLRWEDFQRHLQDALVALIQVYQPAFFSRIGLRYQNVIRRSRLGLPLDTNWSDLLHPRATGLLAAREAASFVEDLQTQTVVILGKGKVTIRTGIVQAVDSKEECFLIDNDFFMEEKTKVDEADGILGYFHRQSGSLFRWLIEERLHKAMAPQPVGDVV